MRLFSVLLISLCLVGFGQISATENDGQETDPTITITEGDISEEDEEETQDKKESFKSVIKNNCEPTTIEMEQNNGIGIIQNKPLMISSSENCQTNLVILEAPEDEFANQYYVKVTLVGTEQQAEEFHIEIDESNGLSVEISCDFLQGVDDEEIGGVPSSSSQDRTLPNLLIFSLISGFLLLSLNSSSKTHNVISLAVLSLFAVIVYGQEDSDDCGVSPVVTITLYLPSSVESSEISIDGNIDISCEGIHHEICSDAVPAPSINEPSPSSVPVPAPVAVGNVIDEDSDHQSAAKEDGDDDDLEVDDQSRTSSWSYAAIGLGFGTIVAVIVVFSKMKRRRYEPINSQI